MGTGWEGGRVCALSSVAEPVWLPRPPQCQTPPPIAMPGTALGVPLALTPAEQQAGPGGCTPHRLCSGTGAGRGGSSAPGEL